MVHNSAFSALLGLTLGLTVLAPPALSQGGLLDRAKDAIKET